MKEKPPIAPSSTPNPTDAAVTVEAVAKAVWALAKKDEAEIFGLASSGRLQNVLSFNVTGEEAPPSLGTWEDLVAEDEDIAFFGRELARRTPVAPPIEEMTQLAAATTAQLIALQFVIDQYLLKTHPAVPEELMNRLRLAAEALAKILQELD